MRSLLVDAASLALKPPALRRGRRVKLPLIQSKDPGTLRLDNARIYELLDLP
ncbi:MAG: hypothetical protein ACRD01_08290 [Terriglobales bacterium]